MPVQRVLVRFVKYYGCDGWTVWDAMGEFEWENDAQFKVIDESCDVEETRQLWIDIDDDKIQEQYYDNLMKKCRESWERGWRERHA